MNAHTPGCRDCTIDYGHGHDGDQIDFCPLHAAARPTLEALEAIMRLIPADIADTVAGYRARAAIRAAKGDLTKENTNGSCTGTTQILPITPPPLTQYHFHDGKGKDAY